MILSYYKNHRSFNYTRPGFAHVISLLLIMQKTEMCESLHWFIVGDWGFVKKLVSTLTPQSVLAGRGNGESPHESRFMFDQQVYLQAVIFTMWPPVWIIIILWTWARTNLLNIYYRVWSILKKKKLLIVIQNSELICI